MQVQLEELLRVIEENRGQIFQVTFIMRSSRTERVMVCRQDVKKHLRGGEAAYSFKEKELIPVFDMQKKDYRSIPTEGIVSAKVNGLSYEVDRLQDKIKPLV